MDRFDVGRNSRFLWALVALATLYVVLMRVFPTLTGRPIVDGSIGVLLGLFICSHPAANAIKILFYRRDLLYQLKSEWAGIRWLALNVLVLVVGWLVITVGVARLVGTPHA